MWFSEEPTVELTVCGHQLSIVQDNTTMHVGTTVWESSLVFAKWLERNRKNGEFSEDRLKGRRSIELGAGCGIAGMAMSLLGCNTTLTDIQAVLPILKKNIKRNMTKLSANKKATGPEPGKFKTAQLNWGNAKQIEAVKPPFDFVVAADVVYLEDIVHPLIATMQALSDYDTVIFLGYKLRQEEAHELFWAELPKVFDIHHISQEEMHPEYAFEGVDLYVLRAKREQKGERTAQARGPCGTHGTDSGVSLAGEAIPSGLEVTGGVGAGGGVTSDVRNVADAESVPSCVGGVGSVGAVHCTSDEADVAGDVGSAAGLSSRGCNQGDGRRGPEKDDIQPPRAHANDTLLAGTQRQASAAPTGSVRSRAGCVSPQFQETLCGQQEADAKVRNKELRMPGAKPGKPLTLKNLKGGLPDLSRNRTMTKKAGQDG